MRQRWFSRRAVALHIAVVLWAPFCLVAFWWQVHRALDGNGLSYLYSVEWPAFAIVGVVAWWSLVHTDPDDVGARAQRRATATAPLKGPSSLMTPPRRVEDEDPELSAYNDRLAALAADDAPKTWRKR